MPTSVEATVAYIPQTNLLLQKSKFNRPPRSVKDIKVDVHKLEDAPSKNVSSTAKDNLIVIAGIGTVCVTVVAITAVLGVMLSAKNATTTTVSDTTTTGTTASTTTAMAAPTNLVAYRGNINQTYTFVLTGSVSGGIWGTTIYTDDSNLATAAVHAGFVQFNQTSVVTVMILAGQNSYRSSTQNGITS